MQSINNATILIILFGHQIKVKLVFRKIYPHRSVNVVFHYLMDSYHYIQCTKIWPNAGARGKLGRSELEGGLPSGERESVIK